MKANVVKGKWHGPRNVLWVLSDELQELLDILWTGSIEGRVVDVYYNLFKIIVLLLPLEQVLSSLIIAEVLEEDQDCQVFEVALL